jgi:hypothetical protein
MKNVVLSNVKHITTEKPVETMFVNSYRQGYPTREFQDARKNFPQQTVPAGPASVRHIYDREGGYPIVTMKRPVGSMYDIDTSGWRNGHVGDAQNKVGMFLAYPYHSYNINERVTFAKPLNIEFKQYPQSLQFPGKNIVINGNF